MSKSVKAVAASQAETRPARRARLEAALAALPDLRAAFSGLEPYAAGFDAAQAAHKAMAMDGIRLGQPVKCVRVDGGWGGTMRVGLSMPQIAGWNALSGEALAAQLVADMARIAVGLSAAAQRQTG